MPFRRFLILAAASFLLCAPGSAQESPARASAEKSDGEVLEAQLDLLRERQDLLVEAAQNDLGRMYFMFATVAAFFALVTVFFGIRQAIGDRQRNAQEERHLAEVGQVMSAFRGNIDTISGLITTLNQSISFQSEVKGALNRVDDRIEELDGFREAEERQYREQADNLNRASASTFIESELDRRDRNTFKTAEFRTRMRSLATHYDTLDRTGDLGPLVSPVVVFIRALDFFSATHYSEAESLLERAREQARMWLVGDIPSGAFPDWTADVVRGRLEALASEATYWLAIIHYNTGKYREASTEFSAVVKDDPFDYRSRTYLPELMFFDSGGRPSGAIDGLADIEAELESMPTGARMQLAPSWESLLAGVKLREGNIFLPKVIVPEGRDQWRSVENAEKATAAYWKTKDLDPDSPFVDLSLAQAMQQLGRSSLWRSSSPTERYTAAFHRMRDEVIVKTEPLLLCLMNYSAAVASWGGSVTGESPQIYLNQARQHLQQVPDEVFVFSPVSKVNLSRGDMLVEMRELAVLMGSGGSA